MRASWTAAGPIGLALAGCDGSGPDTCTEDIRPAIVVRAVDARTGANITDGAGGAVADGTYTETVTMVPLQ